VSNGPRGVEALIVVDMRAAFVSGERAVPAAGALLVSVTGLLRRARREGALAVQPRNDGPPGARDEPGTPGWELFLPPRARDGEHAIPAVPGLAGAVPHAMAPRAAEWSLGDQADDVARAADIRFTPPGP
jgi:nicotinamidase-related amidase